MAQLFSLGVIARMKTFAIIFVISYVGMVLLLMALNFALPDYVGEHPSPSDTFLMHITDAVVMVLAVFSWGFSSLTKIFLLGFPASATTLALLCVIFRRLLSRQKVVDYDA